LEPEPYWIYHHRFWSDGESFVRELKQAERAQDLIDLLEGARLDNVNEAIRTYRNWHRGILKKRLRLLTTMGSEKWYRFFRKNRKELALALWTLLALHKTEREAAIDGLAWGLYRTRKDSFRSALQEELRLLGVAETAKLTDSKLLQELYRISRWDARSIVRTFNRDLQREIREALEVVRRPYDRRELSRLIRDEVMKRDEWKAPQIGLHTALHSWGSAVNEFYKRSSILAARFNFVPTESAVCEECKVLVSQNPHTYRAVLAKPTPLHLQCIHKWKPVYVSLERPWLGG